MITDDQGAPEVYADGVQFGLSPFTAIMQFTMQPAGQTGTLPPIKVAVVRMSLEHAKVMAIILRRQLKSYEENLGQPIPLAPQLYQQLGISRQEDW